MIVIVAVIIVGGLEGREKTVEQVSGTDFDGVHEGFVTQVHAHHFLADELVDARDFPFQRAFLLLVVEDELVQGVDFEGSLQTVFLMPFAGVMEAGEFLVFLSGWCGSGNGVRDTGGAVGDVCLDLLKALLTLGLVALGLICGEELAGLPLAELAAGFDFLHIGVVGNLAVGELVAQLLVRGGAVAGELVDAEVFVEVFEIVLLDPTVEHEAHDGEDRAPGVVG